MRITEEEQRAIVETAREHFGPDCKVILFGSRAHNDRKGGDTDLMIDTPRDGDWARAQKTGFLVDLKQRIGDRRIDVVVRAGDSTQKTVYQVADAEGILLR